VLGPLCPRGSSKCTRQHSRIGSMRFDALPYPAVCEHRTSFVLRSSQSRRPSRWSPTAFPCGILAERRAGDIQFTAPTHRGIGALLRGRAGAEGLRRAADGAARVMIQAGGQAAQPLWGTRLPRPRSLRCLDPFGCLEPQRHAAWVGPRAGANLAHAAGKPRCSRIARTLVIPSRTPRPLSLPPHLTQAKRTRQSQTSSSATLPSPLAASSPSSAPSWPLPQALRSPPPLPLGDQKWPQLRARSKDAMEAGEVQFGGAWRRPAASASSDKRCGRPSARDKHSSASAPRAP